MNEIRDFIERATEHTEVGEEVRLRDIQAAKRLGKQSKGNLITLHKVLMDRIQADNSQVGRCMFTMWDGMMFLAGGRNLGFQKLLGAFETRPGVAKASTSMCAVICRFVSVRLNYSQFFSNDQKYSGTWLVSESMGC